MQRILLVGVYSPDVVKEATGRMFDRSIEWMVVENAPEAYLAIFGENDTKFNLVVIESEAPGLQPSAEGLVQLIRKDEPDCAVIVVGHTADVCRSLMNAGCHGWAEPEQLPYFIRASIVSDTRIAS